MIKQLKLRNKSKHFNSKTHKHKKEYGIIVKEYEKIKPKIDEVDYKLDDVFEDYSNKFFHTFENRCVYDSN